MWKMGNTLALPQPVQVELNDDHLESLQGAVSSAVAEGLNNMGKGTEKRLGEMKAEMNQLRKVRFCF